MKRLLPLLAILAAPAARADQIDRVLVADSADIAARVAKLKPKHIAVLPFRVKIGSEKPTFRQGLEGTQLANKLQNLLVLTNPAGEAGEYVVLGEAAKAAAAAGRALGKPIDWDSEAGRKALLDLKLPCVWDPSVQATPDTYITGDLELTPDLRGATLRLYCFTKSDPNRRALCHLQEDGRVPIRVDRNILADLGRSFAVSKAVLAKSPPNTVEGRTRAVFDSEESAANSAGGKMTAAADGTATAFTDCPVRLTVLYNRRPEAIVADGSGNFKLTRTPPAKTEISFLLTNTDPKPVAVLLTVDGRNVIELNPDERADQNANRERWRKFVLEPNKLYEVKGWRRSLDGKSDAPILVESEEASVARFGSMQPAVAGKIELLVYPAHEPAPPLPPEAPRGVVPDLTQPAVGERTDVPQLEEAALDASPMETVDKAIGRTRGAKEAREFLLAKLPTGTTVAAGANGGLQVVMPKPEPMIVMRTRGLAADGDTGKVDGGATRESGFQHAPSPSSRVAVTYYTPHMAAPGGI